MILTSVRKRRNKIILHFDNSEKLEIDYEVYLNSGLHKGDNIDKKQIDKLVFENELFLTKNSAYRYLGNRNHSSFELKQKLSKKGFQNKIIDRVLNDLRTKGFIDDLNFAKSFVINRVERRKEGIIKINSELRKRGISNEIISEVISNSNDNPIYLNNALELAEKKYHTLKDKNLEYQKLKLRLFNFLKGKGYTPELIFNAIGTILENEEFVDY